MTARHSDDARSRELPVGAITFMFTDVEGSTRLLRALGSGYAELLVAHNRIVRDAVSRHDGIEVRMEGDSFFCVFVDAAKALSACLAAQRALCAYGWPEGGEMTVRMGLHTGEAEPVEADYIGLAVHQAARVVDVGHGRQVLVSDATRAMVGERLPADASLRPLGAYRLKDFPAPTPLFQLCHPDLPSEFPALRTLPATAHNVPEQATLFVDRREEVIELAELVRSCRLVSVIGPGGVGKTRLSTELVPQVVQGFADGVWLVELARLRNAEAVAPEVATVLGVRAEAERRVEETLADALAEKQLLLVLDNCEHVLDAAASLAERLIGRCAGVHVLATTRAPLGVRGETRFSLMPLAVPAKADAIGGDDADAVALFADRARAVTRSFDALLERDAVIEICRRLDGLPLAIELAAARTASIPVTRIAARLDRRFSLVTQSYSGALPHHETLRGSIGWSYDLLEPSERVLLRRLGTFVGAFDLEAAEAICSTPPVDVDDVLDLIGRLTDKSLVQQSDDRYVLLESIREFAREQLDEAGELDELADAHLAYFTSEVEAAARDADGPGQREAYDRLDANFANIRAAAERALARSDPAALALGAALGQYGFVRNRLAEVARWCIDAVAAAPEAPVALRVGALTQAGFAFVVMGSAERGHALVDEGVLLARSADDPELLVRTLVMAADLRQESGRPAEARPLAEEAVELVPATGADWIRARALMTLAQASRDDVGYAETHRRLAEARALFDRQGDRRQVGRVLLAMAYHSLEAGELDAAQAESEQCIAITDELAHPIGQAVARIVQVWVAIDRRDTSAAAGLLAGTIATAQDSGYRALLAYSVAARAALCAGMGDDQRAARILGALAAAEGSFGGEGGRVTRMRIARLRAALAVQLGAEQFAALFAEGKQSTLEAIAAVPFSGAA
jgi:predicted ATPase/class 3 adenylate cyclase